MQHDSNVKSSISLHQFGELLDEKFSPIMNHIQAVDRKVDQLKADVEQQIWEVRCRCEDELQIVSKDMQIEIQNLQYQLQELQIGMQHFANHMGDASFEDSSANAQKIHVLEQELLRVKHAQTGKSDDKYALTSLVGMFPQGTKQKDAEAWLAEKLQSLNVTYSSMYIKGNEFKGILFLKFLNTGMRDNAIQQFLNASLPMLHQAKLR